MRLWFALFICWFACASAHAAPRRIVSLDYCADQFVLGLADRGQIAAVSYGADKDDSYFRDRAVGLKRTRGTLEETLALKPDLIVRNWGGGYGVEQAYARFGIPVLTIGDASSFAEARAQVIAASHAFGQDAYGFEVVRDLDLRLEQLYIGAPAIRPRVLYVTAGGATAGKGVLIDDVIRYAGAENVQKGAGWTVLPLEKLVQRPPAYVALGFFNADQTQASAWSPARHSGWRQSLRHAKQINLPTAAISCAAWFQIDAAEKLAEALGLRE
jgi:iron complex transport system substrate-binding protein